MSGMNLHCFPAEHSVAKRVTDVLLALLIMILFSPVLIVVAVFVRLSSPGCILFRQERIGRRGQIFTMLKFRSLEQSEANTRYEQLVARGGIRYIKIRGFNLGLWLRRSRVDELPQIFNVLRGEMSIVGLRPALPLESELLAWREAHGFSNFPVGMTGLYQTRGSKDLDLHTRLALEQEQCCKWSYWRDLWILLATILVVITRKGAGS